MIRVGIGGWNFKPWRGVFYPPGLRQADELGYASRRLTSIEINATFYRTPSRDTFLRWAEETPDDFVFAVKGPRYVTAARDLGSTGPRITHFLESGIAALGDKLGPLLWQMPPTRRFDADAIEAFLQLLPRQVEGRTLRHVLEVRHDSFKTAAFVEVMRRMRVPIVYADSDKYPAIADVTSDFVYARLMRTVETVETGYGQPDLASWIGRIRAWAEGREPDDLPRLTPLPTSPAALRACFVYVINGAKVRAPAAAMALLDGLGAADQQRTVA